MEVRSVARYVTDKNTIDCTVHRLTVLPEITLVKILIYTHFYHGLGFATGHIHEAYCFTIVLVSAGLMLW